MTRLLVGLVMAGMSMSVVPHASAGERSLESLVREAVKREAALKPQATTLAASKKDSVLNGGLIGAAIGGLAVPPLVIASSGGSDDIRRAWLKVAPVPAIAGFAIGLVIDAMR